jgi:hypothetical protein
VSLRTVSRNASIAAARIAVAACSLIATAAVPPPAAGEAREEARGYLQKVGFAAEDLAALDAGQVIARSETAKGTGEIVAIAAVKIRAPRDRTLAYYGEMVKFVDGKVTLAFGRFSTPPVAADVAGLAFDRGEVDDMKSCRPGDCDVRVGGAGLEALRTAIDWSATDYVEKVNQFVRESALRYVTAYQEKGDEALVTYNDSNKPVSLKQQWRAIVANSPYFHVYAPELKDYLERYPTAKLPGARDVFYWVKENYGALKTVISIVHTVIYEPPSKPDWVLVAQKHIYASHYYDASLAIASLLAAEEAGKPVTYLIYVNRSRGDLLKGGLGGVKRTVAKDQAKKAAEQTLGAIQQVLERAYAGR